MREAIKKFYGPQFQRDLNVETDILVTSGANEGKSPSITSRGLIVYAGPALSGQYSVFTAFLEHGDEVIMFEPFFDQYLPSVTFNGGTPVYVPLHPPVGAHGKFTSDEWKIDFEELR